MIKIEHAAAEKKQGMTLAELREFVAQTMRDDLPDSTRLHAVIGLNGRLQRLETR